MAEEKSDSATRFVVDVTVEQKKVLKAVSCEDIVIADRVSGTGLSVTAERGCVCSMIVERNSLRCPTRFTGRR